MTRTAGPVSSTRLYGVESRGRELQEMREKEKKSQKWDNYDKINNLKRERDWSSKSEQETTKLLYEGTRPMQIRLGT